MKAGPQAWPCRPDQPRGGRQFGRRGAWTATSRTRAGFSCKPPLGNQPRNSAVTPTNNRLTPRPKLRRARRGVAGPRIARSRQDARPNLRRTRSRCPSPIRGAGRRLVVGGDVPRPRGSHRRELRHDEDVRRNLALQPPGAEGGSEVAAALLLNQREAFRPVLVEPSRVAQLEKPDHVRLQRRSPRTGPPHRAPRRCALTGAERAWPRRIVAPRHLAALPKDRAVKRPSRHRIRLTLQPWEAPSLRSMVLGAHR
jgi:hypothetical protein